MHIFGFGASLRQHPHLKYCPTECSTNIYLQSIWLLISNYIYFMSPDKRGWKLILPVMQWGWYPYSFALVLLTLFLLCFAEVSTISTYTSPNCVFIKTKKGLGFNLRKKFWKCLKWLTVTSDPRPWGSDTGTSCHVLWMIPDFFKNCRNNSYSVSQLILCSGDLG